MLKNVESKKKNKGEKKAILVNKTRKKSCFEWVETMMVLAEGGIFIVFFFIFISEEELIVCLRMAGFFHLLPILLFH